MSKTKKNGNCPQAENTAKTMSREKLIFFTILVLILLVIAAALPGNSARMIRICRIFCWRRNRPAQNIYWELTVTEGICFREYWWEARRVFMQHCFW